MGSPELIRQSMFKAVRQEWNRARMDLRIAHQTRGPTAATRQALARFGMRVRSALS